MINFRSLPAWPICRLAVSLVLLAVTACAAPQDGAASQPSVPASPSAPASPPVSVSPPAPVSGQTDRAAAAFETQRAQFVVQMRAKQYDAAIATLQNMLAEATDPNVKANLWAAMSEAYRGKGDLPNSIWSTQQAFRLAPTNSGLATNLALLYELQRDSVHAREYYEKAIANDPNNALALNNLAYLLATTTEELDLALSYATAAHNKSPGAPEVNDTLGLVYLRKNMFDEAIGKFQVLTEIYPKNVEYHYHLAMALAGKGRLATALDECKAALADNPVQAMDKQVHGLMDRISEKLDQLKPQPATAK